MWRAVALRLPPLNQFVDRTSVATQRYNVAAHMHGERHHAQRLWRSHFVLSARILLLPRETGLEPDISKRLRYTTLLAPTVADLYWRRYHGQA